ncbi:MAG: putative peptidoglycan glycosyltransferase FtsW [Eubacteriales bacterium]|nr:putative peptidoglycan glycosyltransferase FtsW [Eubacteriales bacterium]
MPENRKRQNSDSEKTVKAKKSLSLKKSDIFITGSIDIPFLGLTIALLTIGLIMLFSASYPYAYYYENKNSYYFFERQLIFAVVGLVAMFFMSKINYKLLKAFVKPLLFFTLACLVIVLFYHTNVSDFKRWIPLFGGITFQPSDLAKFTIILTFASYISDYYRHMNTFKYGICYPLGIIAVFCGLIFLEHHMSCTILMFLIGATLMFVGGSNWKLFAFGAGAIVLVAFMVITFPELLENYAGERITAWLDKDYDPTGARWQTNNSLYAIGSGGLFGVGLGNSKQKYLYVSEPQNDFIFSIVCEELGFFGALLIIILFGALVIRGFYIASKCKDRFGSLMVIGIVAQIGIQAIFNILVVTDTFPNTGIALPFFSYGGTAMLMLLFEVGVVLSVSRKSNQQKV